jgi:hypothetical protein
MVSQVSSVYSDSGITSGEVSSLVNFLYSSIRIRVSSGEVSSLAILPYLFGTTTGFRELYCLVFMLI